MASWGVLSVAVVVSLMVLAQAHPELWITEGLSQSCTDHPVLGGRYRNHGVAADSSNQFVVSVGASSVLKMCPGAQHTVTVSFSSGETRQGLFTASQGTFGNPYNAACPNRVLLDSYPYYDNSVQSGYSTTLTLPCTATGSVILKASSAASQRSSISQTTATFVVDPSCAAAQCRKSPPPMAKSPPPKAKSPPPRKAPPPKKAGRL